MTEAQLPVGVGPLPPLLLLPLAPLPGPVDRHWLAQVVRTAAPPQVSGCIKHVTHAEEAFG